jgi:protein gp37
MKDSKIEWTDVTWNPVTGCTKVSQGCKNCYAESIFKRFEKNWHKFGDVTCHQERLNQPSKIKKPCKIFVNSMSDLFHEDVPFEFIGRVMDVILSNPQHTFQILTKRPERMKDYFRIWTNLFGMLDNLWLGVSVENQETANRRIPILLDIPAKVRFLSCEPLLGEINLNFLASNDGAIIDSLSGEVCNYHGYFISSSSYVDWVIVGGESGHNARPMHPDWVRSIRDQCQEAGVAFFFKQWGEWMPQIDLPSEIQLSSHGLKRDKIQKFEDQDLSESPWMVRIGKKKAGSLLDGREWKEFPIFKEYINKEKK